MRSGGIPFATDAARSYGEMRVPRITDVPPSTLLSDTTIPAEALKLESQPLARRRSGRSVVANLMRSLDNRPRLSRRVHDIAQRCTEDSATAPRISLRHRPSA